MPAKPPDTTISYQIEHIIGGLDSLSILPSVAAGFLSKLGRSDTSASASAEIVESDPALTAGVLRLVYQQGLSFAGENFSVGRVLDRLPAGLVRDVFFSAGVAAEDNGILPAEQLVLHSLAVGCCAGRIAEIASTKTNPQLAYCAGLMHDIGKLALAQSMPKSFACIVEEAQSQNSCSCAIEQKHLGGLDHTILGKRLAEKWHLPDEIIPAIWLHHAGIIFANMPEIAIAQIVRLADSIARRCGIGQSGSYDTPDTSALAASLAIAPEQLEQISSWLAQTVERKASLLGLGSPNAAKNYCRAVHDVAAQLAHHQTELSDENRRLQTDLSQLGFVADFLCGINPSASAIDIAKDFAVRWQNFYQTGPVCLYLAVPAQPQNQAVVVENLAEPKIVQLEVPAGIAVIPKKTAADFAIPGIDEHLDWLLEQLGVDFAPDRTKLVPLLSGKRAIGVIIFELRYPCDSELLSWQFKTAASVAGTVLDMALNCGKNSRYAEQFAQLITEPQQVAVEQPVLPPQQPPVSDKPLTALAEMAAGAAHELNNPLSVISGRAQLLAKVEADPEKKRMLEQIRENSSRLSQIIDELMTFASPQQPRPARTNIRQMLKDATDLASQKTNVEQPDIQVDVTESDRDVFVDSAQMVCAIANIFANSIESYADQAGPIRVTACDGQSGEFVKLTISDHGCGMDAETVRKATLPFFSAKPAGRKRGMGLAYAARLIELNDSSLKIESRPGSGTTVTILLPSK
jgi:putative nucleotidyltransferase with HDIG domain